MITSFIKTVNVLEEMIVVELKKIGMREVHRDGNIMREATQLDDGFSTQQRTISILFP